MTESTSSILDSFRLDGKIAVVTGASSGLGAAFAGALASAGAELVLAARRTDKLGDIASEITDMGNRAIPVKCDVRKPEDCANLMAVALENYGKVDILVNNAGVGAAVAASQESPDHFRWLISTNLEGAYWCAQQFAMVAPRGSSIVNVSSTLAIRPMAMPLAGYVSSKAGLIGLTRDLAMQWTARKGIRVNALAPGYFPSDMTDTLGIEEREMVKAASPFGRFGDLDEITPALIFLASGASSYMTGTTVAVDGGLSFH